jgi:hypothetical protein
MYFTVCIVALKDLEDSRLVDRFSGFMCVLRGDMVEEEKKGKQDQQNW